VYLDNLGEQILMKLCGWVQVRTTPKLFQDTPVQDPDLVVLVGHLVNNTLCSNSQKFTLGIQFHVQELQKN